MATTLDEVTTDARSADGYVVLFKHSARMTGVLAVPATPPRSGSLKKLQKVIETHPQLSVVLEGFSIDSRTVGKSNHANVFEIKFAIRNGKEVGPILLFLEYLRQCRIITNPIVSDIRDFKVRE
jgi:hypothetical protein